MDAISKRSRCKHKRHRGSYSPEGKHMRHQWCGRHSNDVVDNGRQQQHARQQPQHFKRQTNRQTDRWTALLCTAPTL